MDSNRHQVLHLGLAAASPVRSNNSIGLLRLPRRIVGAPLSSLEEIYKQCCIRRAISIIRDSHHPSHGLFFLLPSGKKCRSISCRTTRMLEGFFTQAVRLINGLSPSPSTQLLTQLHCKIHKRTVMPPIYTRTHIQYTPQIHTLLNLTTPFCERAAATCMSVTI